MTATQQKLSSNAAQTANVPAGSTMESPMDHTMSIKETQDFIRGFNPVNLRYLSAIRGFVPADHSEGYIYGMIGCGNGELLTALAAANPEGVFFGFDSD